MGGRRSVDRLADPRLSQNWALIAGGFGVATLGAKIDRTGSAAKKTGETVSDIAGRALRR